MENLSLCVIFTYFSTRVLISSLSYHKHAEKLSQK